MAERSKTLGSICFGRFELSADTGELRKDGIRLKLSGQPILVDCVQFSLSLKDCLATEALRARG